jgi:hypothetical protein
MLAVARATAPLCALIRRVLAARSDTPDSVTPSENCTGAATALRVMPMPATLRSGASARASTSARTGQVDSATVTLLRMEAMGIEGLPRLRKRGVSGPEARNVSKSAHGPWRTSKTPALSLAMPMHFFSGFAPALFTKKALPGFAAKSLMRPLTVVSDGLACFTALHEAGEHEPTVTVRLDEECRSSGRNKKARR